MVRSEAMKRIRRVQSWLATREFAELFRIEEEHAELKIIKPGKRTAEQQRRFRELTRELQRRAETGARRDGHVSEIRALRLLVQ